MSVLDSYKYLSEFFPDFDYRRPVNPDHLNARSRVNCVGHWQRCVNLWWAVRQLQGTGDVGLEFGSAGVLTPWCLSTDVRTGLSSHYPRADGTREIVRGHLRVAADFHGVSFDRHDEVCDDHAPVYGTGVFPDNSYGLILANHVFEHLSGDPIENLSAWARILKPGGVIAIVMPDNRWFDVMMCDKDHKHAWDGRDFDALASRVPGCRVIEHTSDTQVNYFSFATILQKNG